MSKKLSSPYFNSDTLTFFLELKENNSREWFAANKDRYEKSVKVPMLQFISDFAPLLKKIEPNLSADPRPVGGSFFRIYRDMRFSKDKSPYKTHAGAHFAHKDLNEDVHSPGFYFHIEPGNCFVGAGIWHPNPNTLKLIRQFIVDHPKDWGKICQKIELSGESLKKAPKGFDISHPYIEDLKRIDFTAFLAISHKDLVSKNLMEKFVSACKEMKPLIQFLNRAVASATETNR